ncbi:alpha/beta hydrolase [Plectosphaerella cucumerina]|uniref:Alpha/beta hydrolase n=1 Tax=Plectosphaerella cucumerina TaxID=40658 RepID=A0A8K0X0H1_9PEZI|nr:alpha/beta hydrolase [Plectosphaerella cucumerina]
MDPSRIIRDGMESNPEEGTAVLQDGTSSTFTLSDGRQLGYAQFGLLTGRPVFYCHGLPGCRIEAGHLHQAAVEAGVRLIAADRPGIGLSSPQPGRTILDHAGDLDQLARHLQVENFGVMGVSGGGPYALACAATMAPDRLRCVAIVCGLGPPDIGMSGAGWFHWVGFTIGWRYTPRLAAWFFHWQGRFHLSDEARLSDMLRAAEKKKSVVPKQELEIWKNENIARRLIHTGRQVYTQGIDGVSQDGHLLSTDFGFRLEDIRDTLPVRLWYGRQDFFVPLNHGIQIAKRLGEGAHLRVENETHASIFFRWRKEVLSDMAEHL